MNKWIKTCAENWDQPWAGFWSQWKLKTRLQLSWRKLNIIQNFFTVETRDGREFLAFLDYGHAGMKFFLQEPWVWNFYFLGTLRQNRGKRAHLWLNLSDPISFSTKLQIFGSWTTVGSERCICERIRFASKRIQGMRKLISFYGFVLHRNLKGQ